MITVNLILTIVGLLFLLIALVALYVWGSKSKNSQSAPTPSAETFESLSHIITATSSSKADLNHAVEAILSRFSHIDSHTIGKYMHLLEALCVHPHTDSKLILRFEKTLRTANPSFSDEIEKALAIGLAARG